MYPLHLVLTEAWQGVIMCRTWAKNDDQPASVFELLGHLTVATVYTSISSLTFFCHSSAKVKGKWRGARGALLAKVHIEIIFAGSTMLTCDNR